MNLGVVEQIAKAVLYEGYMLYPYRPSSVKNQQRWNFGVLCPQPYSEAQKGSEAWTMQTECLVEGSAMTAIEVRVRFLQLVARTVGQVTLPPRGLPQGAVREFHPVDRLVVEDRVYQPWQEAIEREVILPLYNVEALGYRLVPDAFTFKADKQLEQLYDSTGQCCGVIIRERKALCGAIEIMGQKVAEGVFRISVRVRNTTPFETAKESSREEALLSSMVSTHTVLGVQDGGFVSSLAPPEPLAELVAGCKNFGTWPVLVGAEGQTDTLLSSPIILYDYPQIAPESAGDLFDGTEIDEILSLRIMTLTDDEKREMSQSDERARAMLERTETMPAEQFMKMHGVLRGMRPLKEKTQ
jgi:hypothetical protein